MVTEVTSSISTEGELGVPSVGGESPAPRSQQLLPNLPWPSHTTEIIAHEAQTLHKNRNLFLSRSFISYIHDIKAQLWAPDPK